MSSPPPRQPQHESTSLALLLVGIVLVALSVHLFMSVLFSEVWFGAWRALADMIQDLDAVFDAFVDGLRGPVGGGR